MSKSSDSPQWDVWRCTDLLMTSFAARLSITMDKKDVAKLKIVSAAILKPDVFFPQVIVWCHSIPESDTVKKHGLKFKAELYIRSDVYSYI